MSLVGKPAWKSIIHVPSRLGSLVLSRSPLATTCSCPRTSPQALATSKAWLASAARTPAAIAAAAAFPTAASQTRHAIATTAAISRTRHATATSAAVPSSIAETPSPPALDFLEQPREGLTDEQGRLLLKNLTLPELERWCVAQGEAPTRARQLWRWLYGDRKWIRTLDDISSHPEREHRLSKAFMAKLERVASISGALSLQSVRRARDGTKKLLFALHPQEGRAEGVVETVLIPVTDKESGKVLRYTACVSTQVGCAMNCQFCFTGRMGLLGQLTTAQIVEQLVDARRLLVAEEDPAPVHNVVFMGMGEPLHNPAAVHAAVDIMVGGAADGLHLGRSKVIVSTVGLVPEMRAFVARGRGKLAVSLHATTDEVRNWLVPVNRRYPLAQLVGALEEMFALKHRKGDNFVIIEYVMLRGINDSREDAQRLAQLLQSVYCMINLIVFNPHEGTRFQPSLPEDIEEFKRALQAAGKVCAVRYSKGDDAMAACGQLGNPQMSSRPAPMLRPPEKLAHLLAAAGGAPAAS